MADITAFSQLSGFLKSTYLSLETYIPEDLVFQREVLPFEAARKQGLNFKFPIFTSEDGGFVSAAPDVDPVAAPTAISPATTDVTFNAAQTYLQGKLSYGMAKRAASSKTAFAESVGWRVKVMWEAMRRRVEISSLYDRMGLGVVSTATNPSGDLVLVTITAASLAPFIWAGKVNHLVTFVKSDGTLATNGVALPIIAVDVIAGTLKIQAGTGNGAGLASLLGSNVWNIFFSDQVSTTVNTGAIPSLVATSHNTGVGMIARMYNSTGTLDGVDLAVTDAYRASTYAVGGALSSAKINASLAQAVNRGLTGNVDLFVASQVFGNLSDTLNVGKRLLDDSQSDEENKFGSAGITIIGAQGARAKIRPSGYMMLQYGLQVEKGTWLRAGATDVTGNIEGVGDVVYNDPSNMAIAWRLMYFASPLCRKPAHQVLLTGITG